jgi:hypothetical protein
MKFNIKNFPKTVDGENRDEADIWVEGFEKELRERLANPSNMRSYDAVSTFIKEILGEDKE